MTTIDGAAWNYDVTVYPKNQTGNPTLDKTVREAKNSTGKNTGSLTDITDGYAHTATASVGDTVDYQIISTLPTITSKASSLSEYTYVDTLSKGIQATTRTMWSLSSLRTLAALTRSPPGMKIPANSPWPTMTRPTL